MFVCHVCCAHVCEYSCMYQGNMYMTYVVLYVATYIFIHDIHTYIHTYIHTTCTSASHALVCIINYIYLYLKFLHVVHTCTEGTCTMHIFLFECVVHTYIHDIYYYMYV